MSVCHGNVIIYSTKVYIFDYYLIISLFTADIWLPPRLEALAVEACVFFEKEKWCYLFRLAA